jgi:hypothetical chaperone protein
MFCGIDFGTSNSTVALADATGARLIPLEDAAMTLPSAVFWPDDRGALQFGRAAMATYLEGEDGRLMRGLKSTLGANLLDEKTMLGGRMVSFRTVIEAYFAYLKHRLEAAYGPLDAVVLGRPVHFVDADEAADARAEATLAEIARSIGFKHIAFQFEPIAAALHYEQSVAGEEIVMIVDIGGGTSDFSILRVSPTRARAHDRSQDILATGGLRIGGTDFDRHLSLAEVMPTFGYKAVTKGGSGVMPNHYFLDLATWHKINALYVPRTLTDIKAMRHEIDQPELLERLARVIGEKSGHAIAMRVEAGKIALSDAEAARILLSDLTAGPNPMATRDRFNTVITPALDRVGAVMLDTLARANLAPQQIGTVFLTGGSAQMPAMHALVAQLMPDVTISTGDMLGSVGTGLALQARRLFG